MGEDGVILLGVIVAIIGGALVTNRNNEPGWKGAVSVLAGLALQALAFAIFPAASPLLLSIVGVIGMAIAGSMFKLPPRLILGVVLISALFQFVVSAFL